MYRWTNSFPIPLPHRRKDIETYCYSTIIGTSIWMMVYFDNVDVTPSDFMFVMDTDTNKIYNIENNHEIFGSSLAQCFTSDGSNLYMIRQRRELRDDMLVNYTIYVMDTTKEDLEWHAIHTFPYHSSIESCQIIGKTLYLLAEAPLELIAIDLSHMNFLNIVPVIEEDTIPNKAMLMINKETLYIIIQEEVRRTVLILENDSALRVVKENIDTYDEDGCTFVENGNRVFYKQDFPKSIDLETYDFVNNDWIRTNVESTISNLTLQTALELNDKIYVIVRSDWHDGHQHDIRVLDLFYKPNLCDSCWTNVIEGLMSKGDMDQAIEVRNKLPDPLRSQMDSVVSWRIAEKEKGAMMKLFKKRFDQIDEELWKIAYDDEIEIINGNILG